MIIESPANPVVKMLRSLEQAKVVREKRLFLAEGVRLVEDGLNAGRWPSICLYTPELLMRTPRGTGLLRRIRTEQSRHSLGSQVFEAAPRALEAASDTVHPQGVTAAFAIPEPKEDVAPEANPLILICDDIQDPGNIGTIFRTAEAAGVSGVWLTPNCVFAYSPKVVRAGAGAHFRLSIYTDRDWPGIGAGLKRMGVTQGRVFVTDAGATQAYDTVDWRSGAALVISNEAHGLSEAARRFSSDWNGIAVAIPMAGGTESLNASVASAVLLFEAARQRRRGRL